jgi:hypothetical protein
MSSTRRACTSLGVSVSTFSRLAIAAVVSPAASSAVAA